MCLIVGKIFFSCPCSDFYLFNCKQNSTVPSLKAITAKCAISQKIIEFWPYYKKKNSLSWTPCSQKGHVLKACPISIFLFLTICGNWRVRNGPCRRVGGTTTGRRVGSSTGWRVGRRVGSRHGGRRDRVRHGPAARRLVWRLVRHTRFRSPRHHGLLRLHLLLHPVILALVKLVLGRDSPVFLPNS
jgi:hypothetical protein